MRGEGERERRKEESRKEEMRMKQEKEGKERGDKLMDMTDRRGQRLERQSVRERDEKRKG